MTTEIYCDESRPELFVSGAGAAAPANALIGSLWLPATHRAYVKDQVRELREAHDAWGEIKWTKVSPSKLDFYKSLVDLFTATTELRFRAIVVDSSRLDLAKFHNDDSELGFYKFYYQMLNHWLEPGTTYELYCDNKVNRDKSRLQTLRRVLQNSNPSSRVSRIAAVSSGESVLVQLCDLLLGATQARFNQSNTGSASKLELTEYLESGIGHRIGPTWKTERKFNVFRIELAASES